MRKFIAAALAVGSFGIGAAQAEITVGFVTSQSGPGSSIGVLYDRGMKAAVEYASSIGEEKIKFIQLDDGSDPSAATRNARKLIEENKVDLLIGTATAPSTIAMVAVANELKVPMIAISPITVPATGSGDRWAIANSLNKDTGDVAAIRLVGREDEELMLITELGTILRTEVGGINRYRRASRGVTVMKPQADDRIVSITVFVDNRPPAEELPEAE